MTHSGLRTNIRETFAAETTKASYPYLLISRFGKELPLLLQGLQEGPLPIVVLHKGQLMSVGTCALSALELNKIRRVYEYDIVLTPEKKYHVNSIETIMEVLPWMVS